MPLRITGSLDETDLLFLPWSTPLEQWSDEYVVALPRGISRHVVRFTRIGDSVFAVKEISAALADHEYEMLTELRDMAFPCVKAVGVVQNRRDKDGEPLDSMLITRHLPYSLPYRAVFSGKPSKETVDRLIDALVLLLVRLHLVGFAWKDCSLSNTLFRRDAGDFAAYLVDAETGELWPTLSDGMRWYDIDTATSNIAGELLDLQAGGKLPDDMDPIDVASGLPDRYAALWSLLTEPITIGRGERHELDDHLRRLNDLGFDVDELQVEAKGSKYSVTVKAKVVETGHHSRRLMRLTGLDVGENQARRMLNDLDAYRAAQRAAGVRAAQDEEICAHRWVTDVFEPVVNAVPPESVGKLEPAEIFHEVSEHRWFLSEKVGYDVGMNAAVTSYIDEVLEPKPIEQAFLGGKRAVDAAETQEIRLVLPRKDRD